MDDFLCHFIKLRWKENHVFCSNKVKSDAWSCRWIVQLCQISWTSGKFPFKTDGGVLMWRGLTWAAVIIKYLVLLGKTHLLSMWLTFIATKHWWAGERDQTQQEVREVQQKERKRYYNQGSKAFKSHVRVISGELKKRFRKWSVAGKEAALLEPRAFCSVWHGYSCWGMRDRYCNSGCNVLEHGDVKVCFTTARFPIQEQFEIFTVLFLCQHCWGYWVTDDFPVREQVRFRLSVLVGLLCGFLCEHCGVFTSSSSRRRRVSKMNLMYWLVRVVNSL